MHKPVPIHHLIEAELVDLNHRVVTRLTFLHEMNLHVHMLDFSVGETVSLQPDGQPVWLATIVTTVKRSLSLLRVGKSGTLPRCFRAS